MKVNTHFISLKILSPIITEDNLNKSNDILHRDLMGGQMEIIY